MRIKIFLTLALLLMSVSAYSQDMCSKAAETANKVYSAFSSGKLEELDPIFVDNYTEHSPFPGVTKTGLAGLKEGLTAYRTGFPDLKFTMVDMQCDGKSKVAMVMRLTGTNTGSFMGMPPTNKKIDIMGIDYVMLNSEGKVTDHWGYQEEMLMMQQLGMGK